MKATFYARTLANAFGKNILLMRKLILNMPFETPGPKCARNQLFSYFLKPTWKQTPKNNDNQLKDINI